MTIPFVLKIFQDNSSLQSNQVSGEFDINFMDIGQLKQKTIDFTLSNKIYSVLADSGRIKTFLTEKNDVNEMICFLGKSKFKY